MALKIKHAILHIMRSGRDSIFSEQELDVLSEVAEGFILKHVRRLFNNVAMCDATFLPESELYSLLTKYSSGGVFFKDTSRRIAQKMDLCMKANEKIPELSMLVVHVSQRRNEFLAVLLLEYQSVYSHTTNDADNQLVLLHSLSTTPSKARHAALFTLHGAQIPISLIEAVPADMGHSEPFFSQHFLQCTTGLSKKEYATILGEVSQEFVDEHFNGNPKIASMINTAFLIDVDAGEGIVNVDNVAELAFEEPDMQKRFITAMRKSGIREDLPLGERVIKSQFAKQRLKSESSVEVRFPTLLAQEDIEFTPHPDGTVSVLLKNLSLM